MGVSIKKRALLASKPSPKTSGAERQDLAASTMANSIQGIASNAIKGPAHSFVMYTRSINPADTEVNMLLDRIFIFTVPCDWAYFLFSHWYALSRFLNC